MKGNVAQVELFLYICGAIMTVSGTITTIVGLVNMAKSPKEKQDARIADLEKRIAEHDRILTKDAKRLSSIEEGNRVTQKAILALLAHGIDGNEIDSMKEAKKELQEYLIER